MVRLIDYVKKTMQEMEEAGFTQGEAEFFVTMLGKEIKENSKRKEYHKPFTVFKYPTDYNGKQYSPNHLLASHIPDKNLQGKEPDCPL